MNLSNSLDQCTDFSCIFSLVKEAVEKTLDKRRVGLSLGLMSLSIHIGAFHQLGSNFIIMNRNLLEEVIKTEDIGLINAYIFHILLHEYLHSLGYASEEETRWLTHRITEKALGPNHPSTLLARYGISYVFPDISSILHGRTERIRGIEIVTEFETDNMNYFG